MTKSPCYKCETRCAECHAKCGDYAEWKTEHQKLRSKIEKENFIYTNFVDYVLNQREKVIRSRSSRSKQKLVHQR